MTEKRQKPPPCSTGGGFAVYADGRQEAWLDEIDRPVPTTA